MRVKVRFGGREYTVSWSEFVCIFEILFPGALEILEMEV